MLATSSSAKEIGSLVACMNSKNDIESNKEGDNMYSQLTTVTNYGVCRHLVISKFLSARKLATRSS